MDYLPIFMSLKESSAVVVGGGTVAARKVRLLLATGAAVRVVAPKLCLELSRAAETGRITHINRTFEVTDICECDLVVAATDQVDVNAAVSKAARAKRIPVNVVDNPVLSTFIMPSIIDRSPVIIAISSGGAAPVLARLLRTRLEALIPARYGRLADFAGEWRARVKKALPRALQRRRFWERTLDGAPAEQVLSGRERAAHNTMTELLIKEASAPGSDVGEVYLVGAGPGDPDLLTFRALRLMQQADVVLYDRLVAPAILELVRRDADRMYVGKARSQHSVPQDQINDVLVTLAKEGKRVLRLKGGDPFIFGRGGEEIASLAEHKIPFQVVPGITAANGCAAYAGIPLTHRDHAQTCVFVTGHTRDGVIDLDWRALAQPNQTVVFYMGVTAAATIARQLMSNGMSMDMPVALVEQGTTDQQRVTTGTLATLAQLAAQSHANPTLIIVGQVVKLREKLAWFEERATQNEPDSTHVDLAACG